jgi:beta-glucosidase
MDAEQLRAIQDQHVLANIHTFAFNDQETFRSLANMVIDERSARESDLLAFEIGIKESNVQSVMCAFNLFNGIYSCENDFLLNEVLKNEWGFRGFVMTDFRADDNHRISESPALAGLDMEIPVPILFGDSLRQAVLNGDFPVARLNDMVHRILRAMFAVGIFDHPPMVQPVNVAGDEMTAQHIEEQGAVLLKNAGNLLPLHASKLGAIAVIGSNADVGVLSGGGSSQVIPIGGVLPIPVDPVPAGCLGPETWDPSSPLAAVQEKVPKGLVRYESGRDVSSAVALAGASDVAIVFANQWETENCDLPDLSLRDNQNELIEAVAAANPRTIVIMETGGAQVMPWLNGVAAVLEVWYPGQRGGQAIANLIFGDVNPSGKLPITFPSSLSDLPRPVIPTPGPSSSIFDVDCIEGSRVGYKWFDATNIRPLFPFGFGLSYTTFAFSDLRVAGSGPIFVSFDITNSGRVAGAEVAQVYLGLPVGTDEPPKRLVGWAKAYLQPNQTRRITVILDPNSVTHPLSLWNVRTHRWEIASGGYTVYVGDSSRDIFLHASLIQ